ncbi:MAG: PEP/pyruvate-binding domain-containing protein [Bryobacteraceae bacterium]
MPALPAEVANPVRAKYSSFRELLTSNNESLELMARLQEDLQHVPPHRDVIESPVAAIFQRVGCVVGALERLTGTPNRTLVEALVSQQQEIQRFAATLQETARPRLSAWLSEVNAGSEQEVGSKAAALGEIRNKVGLPVPDGFVLTTEAYLRYCGLPLWREIRDATRNLDLNDLDALRSVSQDLRRKAMSCAVPRAVEVAIAARAEALLKSGGALAVRSSAKGEGGARTCAGQFLTVLNVPCEQALDAYKQVVASRFSDTALFYRLSTGWLEVDSPMAVLFLPMIDARAAGIMYTRDPGDPKSKTVWITATRGLGLDIASGRTPADMFVVSRSRPHTVLSRAIVTKEEQIVLQDGGGLARVPLLPGARDEPSLREGHLHTLAEWGTCLEQHYRTPQDVEWVLDRSDRLWIVQSRSLANIDVTRPKPRARPKVEPRIQGGRTVYPGQASGAAFLVEEIQRIGEVPAGAIVFVRKPAPEIIQVFPRIAALVAEWGNITGHAASLLREFRVPSVFQMSGAFDRLSDGEPVSLDAVQTRVYPGILWPSGRRETPVLERHGARRSDPIATRLLTLNLSDPAAVNFRPSGCKSTHDVLRYCHEKAIEAMFAVNDYAFEHGAVYGRKLKTALPLNVLVLDLGGGLAAGLADDHSVAPADIVSRPFQALWGGIVHPGVSWVRQMPATLGDLASVLGSAIGPRDDSIRPLGENSYLLVADEYLNLNTRLAYHYSLVDACLSDTPGNNYISFRFEGGGASHARRSLRACFLESCLLRYGFQVDRRTDLVNAWFRKAPAEQTAARLDMLGRLLACSSQLDMYMASREVMNWFVQQFLEGNYSFQAAGEHTEPR